MTRILAAVVIVAAAGSARANDLGGHVGVAIPLVSASDKVHTVGSDFLNVAVPMGLTVKPENSRLAVDFETVVTTPVRPRNGSTSLTVDPGVVYDWGAVATGLRLAFQVGGDASVGVIPLVNRGFELGAGRKLFLEAAFPMFTGIEGTGRSLAAVVHTGVAF